MLGRVDDIVLGYVIRRLRHRAGMTQAEVAAAAGTSDATISRIERGHLAGSTLGALRRIGATLELRLDVRPRWRGGELDRLLDAEHASLGEAVAAAVGRRGWAIRPEASFSIYGEHGSVDLLAFHPGHRALLVVELKTQVTDLQDTLTTLDRKRRLATRIGADLGWRADSVSSWLVILETRTNRRRVADHRTLLRSAFPADGRRMRRWLGDPDDAIRALSLWPIRQPRRSWPSVSESRPGT